MSFLHKIDFLSTSPENYIFNDKKNKTSCGGILFLLIIISTLLYAIDSSFNFFLNEKYDIESYIIQRVPYQEEVNKLNNDPKYNPRMNFAVGLYNYQGRRSLSNNFQIYDLKNKEFIKRNTVYNGTANNISFMLIYLCKNKSCNIDEIDQEKFYYRFRFAYPGCKVNHENKENPLEPENTYMDVPFYYDNPKITTLNWEVVKYSDRRTFSQLWNKIKGLNEEYIRGFFQSYDDILMNLKETVIYDSQLGYYKFLGYIITKNSHMVRLEYKRKFISFFDIISNIGSLFLTAFSFIRFIFSYHTYNFNNYEIMKKILLKEYKKDNNIKIFDNKNINNEKEKNIEKILSKNNDIKNSDDKSINNDNEILLVKNDENEFPKVCCLSYILNSIYCKCCKCTNCCLNSQTFLEKCNEIILKYLSVDYILYNQFMLENLFDDYVWNNPKLAEIDNNDSIKDLKNFITKKN